MPTHSDWLKQIATTYVYPGIVVGVLLAILITAVRIVLAAEDVQARIRRVAALSVPFILVVAVVSGSSRESLRVAEALASVPGWALGLAGLLAGVNLVEIARFLQRSDGEIAPSSYCLILSMLASGLVWVLLFDAAVNLRWLIMSGIASSGLTVVFRGPPMPAARSASTAPAALGRVGECPYCHAGQQHQRVTSDYFICQRCGRSHR